MPLTPEQQKVIDDWQAEQAGKAASEAPQQTPEQVIDEAQRVAFAKENPNLTTAMEFGKGTASGLLSLPDMPTDVSNMLLMGGSWLANKAGLKETSEPPIVIDPIFGLDERFNEAYPVTPGYETTRYIGDLAGSTVLGGGAGGLVSGGVRAASRGLTKMAEEAGKRALQGTLLGTESAIGSELGKHGGRALDEQLGNESPVFETLGTIGGGGAGAGYRTGRNIKTRRDYGDEHVADRKARLERLGINPSISTLGSDAAQNVPTPPKTLAQQQSRIKEITRSAAERTRGGPPSETPASKATIGQKARATFDKVNDIISEKIRGKQTTLEERIGGPDYMHPINDLDKGFRDAIDAAPTTERKKQLTDIYNDLRSNFKPKDAKLHASLVRDRAKAVAATKQARGKARAVAQQRVDAIDARIADNTGISDQTLRVWNSDLGSAVKREGDPRLGYDIGPAKENVFETRATAAERGGLPKDEAKRIQEDTAHLMREREELVDPFTSRPSSGKPKGEAQIADRVTGPQAEQSPLLKSPLVREAPEAVSDFMADHFVRKMGQGVPDPAAAKWWKSLPEEEKAIYTKGDPAARQQLDDLADVTERGGFEAAPPPAENVFTRYGVASGLPTVAAVDLLASGGQSTFGRVGLGLGAYDFVRRAHKALDEPARALSSNAAPDLAKTLGAATVPQAQDPAFEERVRRARAIVEERRRLGISKPLIVDVGGRK